MSDTNGSSCTSPLFAHHDTDIPQGVTPAEICILSSPTLVTLALWLFLLSRDSKRRWNPDVVLLLSRVGALLVTAAQGVLIFRGFHLLACEGHLDAEKWSLVPISGVGIANFVLVFVVSPRVNWVACAVFFLYAASCVAGEWAGRDVEPTSAVQVLLPLQNLSCLLLAVMLVQRLAASTAQRRRVRSSDGWSCRPCCSLPTRRPLVVASAHRRKGSNVVGASLVDVDPTLCNDGVLSI